MGQKTLELTVISAKDLKNVNLIGKMDVYVVVQLSDDLKKKQKTPIHQDGGTNPSWNYTIKFTVNDDPSANQGKYVIFQLKHEVTFGADKDLGEVRVSVNELLSSFSDGKDPNSPQYLTYQVRRSSGRAQGELKFFYKFIDLGKNYGPPPTPNSAYAAPPPVAAYPPNGAGAHPYPSQSHGYPESGQYPHAGYPQGGIYPPASGYPGPGLSSGYPAPGQPGLSSGYPEGGQVYPPPQKENHAYSASGNSEGAQPYPPPHKGSSENHQQQTPPVGVPYSAPGHPPYGGYPPPPTGYPGYPPPGGYPGYPPPGGYPQSSGYPSAGGYPPAGYAQAQKPKKKNNMGLGLGAGLLGGAVGGMMLGGMMDDAFDDGGGFDF